MKTTFGIKNFRVFDENGVDIDLAPITILTGKNSAGKSSIVKAIAVLNTFLGQIKKDKENNHVIDLSSYKIKFNELFEQALGNFKSVLNRNSKKSTITFEYVIHSLMLFQDLKVSFSFEDESEKKDERYSHNGILSQFCVKTMEDVVLFLSKDGGMECNLYEIKKCFYDFAQGEFYAHYYMGSYSVDSFEKKSIKRLMQTIQESKNILDDFDDFLREDIYEYLRRPNSSKEPIIMDGKMFSAINSSKDRNQIFQIPVIENYLANLHKDEIPAKVDELLKFDGSFFDDEKTIIMHLIEEFMMEDYNFGEYWQRIEDSFLQTVKYPMAKEDKFFSLASKGNVMLPNISNLSIKQNLWENRPDLFRDYSEELSHLGNNIYHENAVIKRLHSAQKRWVNTPLDTFGKKYEVMMRLNSAYERWTAEEKPNYTHSVLYTYESDIERPAGVYVHQAYQMLCDYLSRAIEDTLYPDWTNHFIYIPSSRALPKRLYTPETGKDFYYALNEYLMAKTEYDGYQNSYGGSNKKEYVADSFLNKWIGKKGFDIGNAISIESILESAIVVKLLKEDGNVVYLTDEGYGLTQLVSMLVRIETAIIKAKGIKFNNYWKQSDLDGLDTTKFYYEQQTIAVEEPEIHLHPAFQSKLADMFLSASEYNIHFIVETHSEYLVRRVQRLVAETIYKDEESLRVLNPFKIIYCPQIGKPYDMGINIYGRFTNFFDEGFFDVASKDAIAVSKMERRRV